MRATDGWKAACLTIGLVTAWGGEASAETVPIVNNTPLHCAAKFSSFYNTNTSSDQFFQYDQPTFVYAVHTKPGLLIQLDQNTFVSDYEVTAPLTLSPNASGQASCDFMAALPDFTSVDPGRYVETYTIIGVFSHVNDSQGNPIKSPILSLDSANAHASLLDPHPQPSWQDLQVSAAFDQDQLTKSQKGIVGAFDGTGALTSAGEILVEAWLGYQTTDTSVVHSTFGGSGTIVYFDDSQPLPIPQVLAASARVSILVVGQKPPTDQNGVANEAGTISVRGDDAVGLTASPSPATASKGATTAQVVLTATVTGPRVAGGAAPTGQVDFLEGTTSLGSHAVGADGTATVTVPLGAGHHFISAFYEGGGAFQPATSSPVDEEVIVPANDSTKTVLSASETAPVVGTPVVLTSSVTDLTNPGSTPTGSVTFYDGANLIQGPVALLNGTAMLTTIGLTVGSHDTTAYYAPDPGFDTSPSNTVAVNVSAATTTTMLSTDQSSVTVGQTVNLTATVMRISAPAGPVQGGAVAFMDGATLLGAGPVTLDSTGHATLPVSTLGVGTHSLTASFQGTTDLLPSTSAPPLPEVVNKASSSTSLAASNPTPVAGDSVMLTAAVTSSSNGPALTGTVTFQDGGTTIGPVPVSGGQAAVSSGALADGPHSITATYSGDAIYATSMGSTTVVASRLNTQTTLSASSSSPVVGTTVDLTAGVTTTTGRIPTGSVKFFDGTTQISGAVALTSIGTATFSTNALAVGQHSITAQYSGDTGFNPSNSGVASVGVVPVATTTALSSSANPSTFGQTVNLSATVSAPSGAVQVGAVTFKDGTTVLGTGPVALDSTGHATLSVSTLGVGGHSLTASFQGTTNFAPSTSPVVTQVVNKATSSTTVIASNTAPPAGSSVTLIATVSGLNGGPAPTGTVTFKDGTTPIGTAPVVSGQASLPSGALASGTHSITAAYGGDSIYLPSSGGVTITVAAATRAATCTTLCLSPNPAAPGQAVTMAVQVTSAGGTPTGTVTFTEGTTTLGTATLSGGRASITVSTLAPGLHTIVATYGGSAAFAPSSASGVETIQLIATTTTLSITACQPVVPGQSVTLIASVRAASGTPGGTVTFLDGTTVLGTATLSSGNATLSSGALAAGTHSFTARYGGSPTYAPSTSAPVSLQVGATGCGCCKGDLQASPSSLWPPNHKMVTVTVSGLPGQTCRIVGVTSNEAVNAPGSGNTAPDWTITGPLTVSLRAERSGPSDGRVYTITVECVDGHGVKTTHTACVCVPHDQGGDDGSSSGGCNNGGSGGDDGHSGGGCGGSSGGDDGHSGNGCGNGSSGGDDGHSGNGCGNGNSGGGHSGGGCGK